MKPVDFKFQNPNQENQVSTDLKKKNLKYLTSFLVSARYLTNMNM